MFLPMGGRLRTTYHRVAMQCVEIISFFTSEKGASELLLLQVSLKKPGSQLPLGNEFPRP